MKSHWQIHISLPCNTFTRRPGRPWNLSLFLYLLSLSQLNYLLDMTGTYQYTIVYMFCMCPYISLSTSCITYISYFIVTNLTVNSNIIIALHSLTVNNYNSSAHLHEIFNYSQCLTHHMYRYIISSF